MTRTSDVLARLAETRVWQEDLYRDLHAHPGAERPRDAHGGRGRRTAGGLRLRGQADRRWRRRGPRERLWPDRSRARRHGRPAGDRADRAALCVEGDHRGRVGGDGRRLTRLRARRPRHLPARCRRVPGGGRDVEGTFIALFQPAEETARAPAAWSTTASPTRSRGPMSPSPSTSSATRPEWSARRAAPCMSAGDSVRITVFGKGSHGSMPHLGVDPVVLAASIVLRLQTIVARETKPGEFAVVTVGSSHRRDQEQHHPRPCGAARQRPHL